MPVYLMKFVKDPVGKLIAIWSLDPAIHIILEQFEALNSTNPDFIRTTLFENFLMNGVCVRVVDMAFGYVS